MPTLENLGFCIEYINSAETVEIAFSRYSEILQQDGYDKVFYSLKASHYLLSLPKEHKLTTHSLEDCLQHHIESYYQNNKASDIKEYITKTIFFEDELFNDHNFPRERSIIIKEINRERKKYEITISFTNKTGDPSGVAIIQNKKGSHYLLEKVYFLSKAIHDKIISINKEKITSPKLTLREKDVILLACEGNSDQQISDALSISVDTVRFHWKNIFKKLESKNKTHAVAKSIQLGSIIQSLAKPI